MDRRGYINLEDLSNEGAARQKSCKLADKRLVIGTYLLAALCFTVSGKGFGLSCEI